MDRTYLTAILGLCALLSSCSGGSGAQLPQLIPQSTAQDSPALIVPSETPTPTPPPRPAQILQQGERALSNGDWDTAMQVFQQIVVNPVSTSDEIVAAQLGIGIASLKRGDFGSARAVFDTLLTQYPDHPLATKAYFLRGDARLGLSDWSGAIDDFRAYESRKPGLLDSYTEERIADAYLALGQTNEGLSSYDAALAASRDFLGLIQLREKVAAVQRSLGEVDLAIAQYTAILDAARNPSYRATIEFNIAQAYLEAGRNTEGYQQLEIVFMNYPESVEALSSLRSLLDANIEVNQFQRGVVNYNQGQYEIALEAFYNYLAGTSINYPPDAHLYIARSYRKLGNPQSAQSELQAMLRRFRDSDSPSLNDALLELADTDAELGDVESAFGIYDQFVTDQPDSPQARDALLAAAHLAESGGDLPRAVAYLKRTQNEYPEDERPDAEFFRLGIQSYQAGDFLTSESYFQQIPDQNRGVFWDAKSLLAMGQTETAQQMFATLAETHPTTYYGLRGQNIIDGSSPFRAAATLSFPPNPDEGRDEAESWLIQKFGLENTLPLAQSLRADLATDPRILRGQELWELGMQVEARAYFEDIRQSFEDDPLALYQLSVLFRDIGLYRSSVLASRRIMDLADVNPLDAPSFLARLRYPIYFSDLILAGATKYNLDPLWVLSLIWQESIFEGFAVSTASAQGLMQIWPPTGADIASRLQWPGYQPSDLQRPYINVEFGTWLLREELNRFDNNQFAALSAYNAGPGSTAIWLEVSQGDPDLFVESITLDETQNYIPLIYQHYAFYRALYGSP